MLRSNIFVEIPLLEKKISTYEKSLSSKKLPEIIKYNRSLLKDVDLIFTALPNCEAQDISNDLLRT